MLEIYLEQLNNHLKNLYYVKEAKLQFLSLRQRLNLSERLKQFSEKYSDYNYYKKIHRVIEQCSKYNSVNVYGYHLSHTDRKYGVLGLTLATILLTPILFKTTFRLRAAIPWFLFYSLLFCRESLNPYMHK